MRSNALHFVVPQDKYAKYLAASTDWTREVMGKAAADEQKRFNELAHGSRPDMRGMLEKGVFAGDDPERDRYAKALIKARAAEIHGENGENFGVDGPALRKAGVTSSLGYNFYDLRAPVQLLYPVNTPFRNSLPRIGRVNDGYGTAAHWMATKNPGTVYAGVSEGHRNAIATPDQNPYTATYKEIGVERGVTFTAQFAGEGFADNVADEHLRGLHELALQEEGLMLFGNSGTASGNNGFALGTAPTPVVANPSSGGSLSNALTISVAVVAITALGFPNNLQYGYNGIPTVGATGLVPSFTRTNQDGSTDTVNGGTSAISAIGTSGGATSAGNNTVKATCASVPGAVAYAWYVGSTAALGSMYLYQITTSPAVTISTNPVNTNQAGNATGLNADHSFNALDFDGLLTYVINNSSSGAYYKDLLGASLTSNKDGSVAEIEAALYDRYNQFQTTVDAIWCGPQARLTLDQAIKWGGTSGQPFRFEVTRDQQGNLMGGYLVASYMSKWSSGAGSLGQSIPIYTHPMLPAGAIYLDINKNPYPHSRIPFVRGMLVQREYYSIEWPLVTRQWTFGTYCHEVLAHNVPWISGLIMGVGAFVAN